jgi:quercetin dioxygenase-like cupin family protein
MTMTETPRAVLRSEDDCPFVDLGDGSELQLLQVDIPNGLWVIRTRFQPGYRVPTHKHTGQVFAFTISGAWKYEEYPEVMTGGSYLYEPAHSVHTLIVPEDATEVADVWFAIYGANLNLDAEGNVESIVDAEMVRDGYLMMCEAEGKGTPNVIGVD